MAKKYIVGVDIGGTNIRAALITFNGEVVPDSKAKAATGKDPVAALHKLLGLVYAPHAKEICGIGVAVAGVVDRENGIVLRSPNIPKLNGVQLSAEIGKWYKTTVAIENDANAAAYGEKFSGVGKDIRNFVMLTLGTGIGGGVVIDDKLLPVAAEIGHMSISAGAHQQCPCGNVGCLELYASATAIIGTAIAEIEKGKNSLLKDFYHGNFYKIKAEDVYKAALEGDTLARGVLRDAGKSLGVGIASVINIFSPDAVVLTGGLIGAWNIYVEAAIQEASKRAFKELYNRVKIIPSSLGDDAGMIGAANLILEKCKG
ncbi:MAG: ROK family protein [Nitrospirota bacterium]